MDIIGRNKNFGLTLFFAISALFLAYVMIFAVYQAYREREYKKELAGVRVTIINSDGVVLMDTENDMRFNRHCKRGTGSTSVAQARQTENGIFIRQHIFRSRVKSSARPYPIRERRRMGTSPIEDISFFP